MFRTLLLSLVLAAPAFAQPTDYARGGGFKGRILFVNYDSIEPNEAHVPGILRGMGFTVDVKVDPPQLPKLEPYDQLWLVSSCVGGKPFGDADVKRIAAFVKQGKGLYNVMDNVPCIHEGAKVGAALHGFTVSGAYDGQQMVNVVSGPEMKRLIKLAFDKEDYGKLAEYRRAGFFDGKLYAEDHELLSGIQQIYEGITVCHLSPSEDLEVILRASDNQSLVAVSKKQGEKVVHDCAFTRMFHNWERHASTSTRWYQNVAAYLAGLKRSDLAKAE